MRVIHTVPAGEQDSHDLLQHICPCAPPDLAVTAGPPGRFTTIRYRHHPPSTRRPLMTETTDQNTDSKPVQPAWLDAAERIEVLLREIEGVGFVTDPVLLSRHLAERGVRVDTEGTAFWMARWLEAAQPTTPPSGHTCGRRSRAPCSVSGTTGGQTRGVRSTAQTISAAPIASATYNETMPSPAPRRQRPSGTTPRSSWTTPCPRWPASRTSSRATTR